jgi:hypothetical protein
MTDEQQMVEDITKAVLEPETGSEAVAVTVASIARTSVSMPGKPADRTADFILLKPMTPAMIDMLAGSLVDRHERLAPACKEQAKDVAREIIGAGGCGAEPNARAVRRLVEDIASLTGIDNLHKALAEKYPAYGQRVSLNSGKRLADEFTRGTAGATQALKPLKLKSGRVGFFSLN